MTLLIYFLLTSSLHWEFLAIEHVSDQYCTDFAETLDRNFRNQPGNMKIVCAPDEGRDI